MSTKPIKKPSGVNDPGTMLVTTKAISIVARVMEAVGGTLGQHVPYVNLLTAPLFVAHAGEAVKGHVTLLRGALAESRWGDALFEGGEIVYSGNIMLSDIAKGFAGGVFIAGIHTTPLILLITTVALPIVLIIAGGIGTATRGWAIGRAFKQLKEAESEDEKVAQHRKIASEIYFFATWLLVIGAGSLYLFVPQLKLVATSLSITSCVLVIAYVAFEKGVSNERFRKIDPFAT